jgi:ABC-2 type transport system ATP-binding protein
MIEVKNLAKRYGAFTALQGLSLKAGPGSIYGLVGYNGAGKTTLLKCAIGMFKPEEGRVLVEGEDVFDNAEIKRKMFFIPDELFFLPQASLLRMARFYSGFYPNWSEATFEKLVELFKLDPKARINGFSKGMQRQAAIILGLSTHPKYLLLDEIFDGLDPVMRNLSRQLLLEAIAGYGTTVIISSHNLRELEDLCDHIGVINSKHIVYDSSIEDLRSSRRQYRVVLAGPASPEAFEAMGCTKLKIDGRIATFVARGPEGDTDSALAAMSPVFVEKLPMTLEEIFLDEMEVGEYDFSGIFEQAN